jgi:hypothetical protein
MMELSARAPRSWRAFCSTRRPRSTCASEPLASASCSAPLTNVIVHVCRGLSLCQLPSQGGHMSESGLHPKSVGRPVAWCSRELEASRHRAQWPKRTSCGQ